MSANSLLNAVGLLMTYGLARSMDKTPRKMYNRYMSLAGLGWGSVYPKFTNLGVIAISYSCIAPLVLGFATIGLGLLYLVYRHNFLYVYNNKVDTRGMAYARALQQLTVGVYLAEFCLIGLFAIRIGDSSQAVGPLILMITFTVGTVLYHIKMRAALSRHTQQLPADLLAKCDREMQRRKRVASSEDVSHESAQAGAVNGVKDDSLGMKDRLMGWFTMNDSIELAPCFEEPASQVSLDGARNAYCQPCIASAEPVMWIARDDMGISRREIKATRRIINATDEHAWFDDKGNVVWDRRVREAPLWEDGKVDN